MTESIVTFLFELANFLVFAILLGWFFVKPIRRFLEKQTARDAQAEQSAKQHLDEAKKLQEQLRNERDAFAKEMEKQRQSVLEEARSSAQKMLDQATMDIEHQHEQLLRDAEQIRNAQQTELASIIASASRQAVADLLVQIRGPSLEKALIKSACRQLKENGISAADQIVVETASELNDSTKEEFGKLVGLENDNGFVQFRVSPELLGGLRIKSASGLIDHSISGLSAFVEQHLRRELNHHD